MEPGKSSAYFKRLAPPKRWEDLKTFGSSRVIRTAYFWFVFVPIAAKLIAPIAGQETMIWGLRLHIGLPFSWQCFFFAALFFSAANLIYDVRCPWIIKRFSLPGEFLSAGFSRLRLKMEAARLQEALEALPTKDHDDVANLNKVLGDNAGHPGESAEELRNMYIVLTGYADHIHPGSRRAATWLYYAGFLLIGVVVAQNIWSVLRVLF